MSEQPQDPSPSGPAALASLPTEILEMIVDETIGSATKALRPLRQSASFRLCQFFYWTSNKSLKYEHDRPSKHVYSPEFEECTALVQLAWIKLFECRPA